MAVTIRARAPLRLGLAGGGTDVSPYCDQYGGYVLNATIDRYAYAVITLKTDTKVKLSATDMQVVEEFSLKSGLNGSASMLPLHHAVYQYMMRYYNNNDCIAMELSTYCDAPVGSGLGSSSTLVVAMIKAFVELLNLPFGDYEIAQLAYKIERVDCALQGGRQDQYSATFGGFNFMEFYGDNKTIVNPLRIKNWILCELEASLLLYYTGVSRESATIIHDQSDGVTKGVEKSIDALHGIKNEAVIMKECIIKGDFSGVISSLKMGWENKKRSAKTVSNGHLNSIYDAAINAGAEAGKISGAGGGGFMLFFVRSENRQTVIRALSKFDGEFRHCHFTKHGCQAWRI